MSMFLAPRPRVALGVRRRAFLSLITRAQAVQAGIAGAAGEFPEVDPKPAELLAQIQALEAAQQRTTARVPGASADRNAAADALLTSLEGIRAYVQGLCDASPGKAAQLAAAASLKVIVSRPADKPILAAKLGVASGSVLVRANKRALVGKTSAMCTFHWEYSLDGQKTWIAALATPVPETTLTGLPPLATVSFRVSVTTKKETGASCQPVSILVH